jgi:hypothetical protein
MKDQIIRSPDSTVLLIENYLQAHDSRWQPLYFPDCLNSTDKETMVFAYINSANAHLNMLRLISTAQSSTDLQLSDKTILAASKRYSEEVNKHFANNPGIECSVEVSFSENQSDPIIEDMVDMSLKANYSTNWIKENLDYPTLLNNFIYLFGYVDKHFRSHFVHKKQYLGLLEQLAGAHGKRDYYTGAIFNQLACYIVSNYGL